jgi:hypothetical protein
MVRVFACLIGMIAFALPATSSAAAMPENSVTRVPLNTTVGNACTGETVTISGTFLVVLHIVRDGNEGFHITFNEITQGVEGVGESGTRYRYSNVYSNAIYRGTTSAETLVFEINLVSSGSSDNSRIRETIHFTITPDGDMTADVVDVTISCTG